VAGKTGARGAPERERAGFRARLDARPVLEVPEPRMAKLQRLSPAVGERLRETPRVRGIETEEPPVMKAFEERATKSVVVKGAVRLVRDLARSARPGRVEAEVREVAFGRRRSG